MPRKAPVGDIAAGLRAACVAKGLVAQQLAHYRAIVFRDSSSRVNSRAM